MGVWRFALQVEFKKKKFTLSWFNVIIIFILLGVFEYLLIERLSFLLSADEVTQGMSQFIINITVIVSIFSLLFSWVIVSIVLKFFLTIITECEEKLKQSESFFVVGHSMVFILIALVISFCVLYFNANNGSSNFSTNMSKYISQVGSMLQYASLVIFASWYEKLTRKQTIALSIVFAVMFIVPIFIRTAMSRFS